MFRFTYRLQEDGPNSDVSNTIFCFSFVKAQFSSHVEFADISQCQSETFDIVITTVTFYKTQDKFICLYIII